MFHLLSLPNSTSWFIGVSFNKAYNKWESYITVKSKKLNLGIFNCEIEAAKARDEATKEHYKEYGKLNFNSK